MIENDTQFRMKATRLARLASILNRQNPLNLTHYAAERRRLWQAECLQLTKELQAYLVQIGATRYAQR